MKNWERLVKTAVYTLCVFVLCWAAFQEYLSPDYHWQLKMGLDLIEKGLSPFVDHYSFTFAGQPIHGVPWLFQVFIAVFYKIFGDPMGIIFYKIFFWLSPLWLISIYSKRIKAGVYAELLGLLLYANLIIWHRELRPETTFYVFTFGMFILLFDLRAHQYRWREVVKVFALLAVWTNVHLSALFGFFIVFCFLASDLADLAVNRKTKRGKKERKEILIKIISAATFIVLAGFLNPELAHPILIQMKSKPQKWSELILEYQDHGLPLFVFVYLPFFLWTFVSALRKKRWDAILIISVLSLETYFIKRLVYQLVAVSLPFVIAEFGEVEKWALKLKRNSKNLVLACGVLVLVGIMGFVLRYTVFIRIVSYVAAVEADIYSSELIDYFKKNNIHSNVFNEYAAGGFLLFNLSPQVKVAIDGRTNILYPFDYMQTYTNAAQSVVLFKEFSQKYNFDSVLASNRAALGNILHVALESGEFQIQYQDVNTTFLTRTANNFPLLSVGYARPECLYASDLKEIKNESVKAKMFFPAQAPAHYFYKIFIDNFFSNKKNEISYALNEPALGVIRLIGAIAVKRGHYDIAVDLYNLLGINFKISERLAFANALCEKRNCRGAENFINVIPSVDVNDNELVDLYRLVGKIEKGPGLKLVSNDRLTRLRDRVSEYITGKKKLPVRQNTCERLRKTKGLN